MERTDGDAGPSAVEGQSTVLLSVGTCTAELLGCSKGKQSGQMINLASRLALKLFLCGTADTAKDSWLRTKQAM